MFIAHPGHELRILGWVRSQHPYTTVLTDGSGSLASSRIASSGALLAKAGALLDASSGLHTDRDVYERILQGDAPFFLALRDKIAAMLDERRPDVVVGDAEEGYNSVHDLFHHVVNAAVRMVSRPSGWQPARLVFKTVGRPEVPPALAFGAPIQLRLDAAALDDKIEAALGYAGLEEEARRTLAELSKEAFALECLFHEDLDRAASCAESSAPAPYYETYGEEQVARGLYASVLRCNEHMLPIKRALFDAPGTR